MATVSLTYDNKINASAQVGDTAYYVTTSAQGGFTTSLNNISPTTENVYVTIGTIRSISDNRLNMVVNTSLTTSQIPTTSHFIFFSKDNIANMTTALGYYAEVVLKNNSLDEAELFSVGSDYFESSK
tara:strand:- start:2293 stop:2673 length:381 start_codon:yes stop_codon:yes gene_type:complete